MKEPLTDELLKELLDAPDPDSFVRARSSTTLTLSEYLSQLLEEHRLTRAEVIRQADLNSTFGYQIFVGQRQASRDKVLQIAFAMRLSLTETNRLLQSAKVNGLYCKNRRDAIMIFCLTHRCGLQETNEELYRWGEDTIG